MYHVGIGSQSNSFLGFDPGLRQMALRSQTQGHHSMGLEIVRAFRQFLAQFLHGLGWSSQINKYLRSSQMHAHHIFKYLRMSYLISASDAYPTRTGAHLSAARPGGTLNPVNAMCHRGQVQLLDTDEGS
jgi:hypothetical protein